MNCNLIFLDIRYVSNVYLLIIRIITVTSFHRIHCSIWPFLLLLKSSLYFGFSFWWKSISNQVLECMFITKLKKDAKDNCLDSQFWNWTTEIQNGLRSKTLPALPWKWSAVRQTQSSSWCPWQSRRCPIEPALRWTGP